MLDARGLPRTFWILWTGALVNRLGGFVMPLLALYLTGPRGLAVQQAGLVISLYGAGVLGSAPLGGFLADRIGRRPTLILALVLGAFAMLHLAFARAPAHIAAAAFLLGLLGDLYRPAVSAVIADLVPSQDRVRAYGFLYWAVNLGFAVGSALGGAMASHGWYLLFVGDAATTLAYAGIVWWKIPETRPAHLEHEERPPAWAPLADGRFVAFCALIMLVWTLFHQAFVTLPVDLRNRGLSPGAYGSLIALNGVLIVLLQPIVSQLLARFQHHRVLAVAALLVGIGLGLTGVMRTIPGLPVAIRSWSLGEIVMGGIGPAVAPDAAPPLLRGAYQGLYQAGGGAAALVAPVVGSQVMGRFGSQVLWTCCLGVGCVTALGQLALGSLRRHQPEEELMEASRQDQSVRRGKIG